MQSNAHIPCRQATCWSSSYRGGHEAPLQGRLWASTIIRAVTRIEIRDPSLPRWAPTERRGTKRRKARALTLAAGLTAFLVLVMLLYTLSLHNVVGDSDSATVVLEGQSMAGGDVMLHGWALSLDSFWTIDALFYMLVELVTGMRDFLLYFVPALMAALGIVVGAWMARDGRRGMPGVVAAATVVAVLGCPSHVLSVWFLQGPLHVGTALWCLIAFAGLRSGRLGWGWVVAVGFFAAGALGDLQMIALGIVPACAAGVVAMLRTRSWRSGLPTVSAAVVGLIVAWVVRELATAVGTFTVATSHPTASPSEMLTNVGRVATWGANLLGVGRGGFTSGGVPGALQGVHVLGLLAVMAGVVTAILSLVRGAISGRPLSETSSSAWRLDDLLVIAFIADLVVFIVLTSSNDPHFMRYLTAAVIFGAILAGRWIGRLAGGVESARHLRVGKAVFLAITAAFAAMLVLNVTAPSPSRTYTQLGRFLEAHHLHLGVGDYWSASITTVVSQGSVMVRPVVTTPKGKVVRYDRQSTSSWYVNQPFAFLVFNTARPWGGVDAATSAATFGPVARTYIVGTYRVLVWSHRITVSSFGFSPVPTAPSG